MKKLAIAGAVICSLFFASCQKDAVNSKQYALQTQTKSDYIAQGDGASGVNPVTGYTDITKHYISQWNAALQRYEQVWDGRWETAWYNYHFWVTIETYKIGSVLGDPVSIILSPDNSAVSVTTNGGYLGAGYTSFTMTVPTFGVVTNYSATALSTYDQQLRSYFNGTLSQAPTPPGSSLGKASINTFYGKAIKTNTADGFGLAQIDWVAPPAPKLPYSVNQTSQSFGATTTISGGLQTVKVVDNKTLSTYTPTITFKLTSANQLSKTGSIYDVTSVYTSTNSGVTWSQSTELFPNVQYTANTVSFGLEGHFTGTNVSSSPLAIWVMYNYVTKIVTISYNNSAYLSYWQINAM